jgi:hypothetical protein
LDAAADADEVSRRLVLVMMIEPASKLDSVRVLEEAGITPRRRERGGGPSAVGGRAIDGYQQDREWAAAHDANIRAQSLPRLGFRRVSCRASSATGYLRQPSRRRARLSSRCSCLSSIQTVIRQSDRSKH